MKTDPVTRPAVTAESLTDSQLEALFAAHCECRPMDIDRAEHEHSHDCDTGILDDIQTALNATDAEEQFAARTRCVGYWIEDLDSSIYEPLLREVLARPPMTVQEFNRLNAESSAATINTRGGK